VNNYRINLSYIAALCCIFFSSIQLSNAQINPDFGSGNSYILGDVEVTGKTTFNSQTIVTYTGLEKGQRIIIPGEEISNAIKKLGKLNLFSDIDFFIQETRGDTIFLELNIEELPKLNEAKVTGIKKGKAESIINDNKLKKGTIVNENLITTTKNKIESKYRNNGFFNAKAYITTSPSDTTQNNLVNMLIRVDRGNKIKVRKIEIVGNEKMSNKKVKKAMKNTKTELPGRFWKGSKYIKEKYQEDLTEIVNKYKEKGYRDARVVWDSVQFDNKKNRITIKMKVEEGNRYYFGDIKFLGNTIYTDEGLARVLGIKKGDVYNGVLLEKRINDKKKPDGEDITNLYQNNGYLFSQVNPVEVKTANDTIDFEIRITEGPIAYFNKITVVGNDKTNDHVIYRELRTKPGQKYSKQELVRTIREIGQLGFFDPEAIDPKFKNVDPSAGTVDIEYNLVEKGASQIELQGGYGGGGFIGTLGLSFNNFSLRNIFNKDAYKPLPMGDGQRMSLRLQGSNFFQTYSLNFEEPWWGGKKPIRLSTSISHSKQFLANFGLNQFNQGRAVDRSRYFNITSLSLGIAKRLTVPDDYFLLSQSISYQYFDLKNYNTGLFTFGDGQSHNLAYTVALTRNSKAFNPIYPTQGSEFTISAKFTPPYSLFDKTDYANLGNQAEYKLTNTGQGYFGVDGNWVAPGDFVRETTIGTQTGLVRVDNFADADADQGKIDQKRFNWLEFYKIKFRGDWYTTLVGQQNNALVLRANAEFGFMGAYNQARGLVPFERFFVGGDGLANFVMDGREIIQLRGYENQALTPVDNRGFRNGGTIYNKFTLELRYPITLKGAASIYALSFLEAGSAWNDFTEFNPFRMQRSAGFGLRVFMPAFGLLGIDFGHGFDAPFGTSQKSGWQTHFIIGQQF